MAQRGSLTIVDFDAGAGHGVGSGREEVQQRAVHLRRGHLCVCVEETLL